MSAQTSAADHSLTRKLARFIAWSTPPVEAAGEPIELSFCRSHEVGDWSLGTRSGKPQRLIDINPIEAAVVRPVFDRVRVGVSEYQPDYPAARSRGGLAVVLRF